MFSHKEFIWEICFIQLTFFVCCCCFFETLRSALCFSKMHEFRYFQHKLSQEHLFPTVKKLNLKQLILSISVVFSVLHKQILTTLSRGGRQTEDMCYSASQRQGRDLTQCVRIIWQDMPHVLSERSKNVPPSLRLVFSVHHSAFSLTVERFKGGFEMLRPVKQMKEWEKRKERGTERKRSQTRDLFGHECVWSWQGTQLRVTLMVGAAKLPLPVVFIHT